MVGVRICGLLVLLGACGAQESPRAGATAEAITLTGDDGRTVTLPHPVRRIVSLVPSATEVIVALGARDRLVGRTRFDRDSSLRALPLVGGGLDPNLETLVDLAPELVVTWSSAKRPETQRRLGVARIPALNLALQDTAATFRSITLLGQALGLSARADSLLRQLRDSLTMTGRRAATQERRRVFYVAYNDPPMTMGPGTFIAQILAIAGGDNIFADATMNWTAVSLEQVVRRDPDVVVLPIGEQGVFTPERLRTEPGWRELRAVRRGCVVQIEADVVNRPGPSIARAAELLRIAIHRPGCGA